MRSAETVLAIIRERGKQGLPLEDIYRQLYNPMLYLRAYAKLYPNHGAMTPGSTTETVDGMSLVKINKLERELNVIVMGMDDVGGRDLFTAFIQLIDAPE